MNWINYDRLVNDLETMNPALFNHYNPDISMDDAVCVACWCCMLTGQWLVEYGFGGTRDIESFLGCSLADAAYLYTPGDGRFSGPEGIQNALHRLRTVAAKYPRPAIEQPVAAFVADDAAFLAACRAMAQQPVDVETQC